MSRTMENSQIEKDSSSFRAGVFSAILATVIFAFSVPTNKLMLNSGYISETIMASFLYFGSGLGMFIMLLTRNKEKAKLEKKPGKKDVPWIIAMVLLDSAASILTIWGLSLSNAATASLLGNFEIFVTVIFAALLFKEKVSPRLMLGIILVFLASMVLSFEDISSFKMSPGAIVVIIASLCWGFENNVTRRLSGLDTTLISTIKGTGTGITNLAIAFILGERITTWWMLPIAMAVGFVTYGLSFFFYLMAQRRLGASRTSAIFALAPFLGSFVSFFIFAFLPTKMYIVAVSLMGMGVYLASSKQESAK